MALYWPVVAQQVNRSAASYENLIPALRCDKKEHPMFAVSSTAPWKNACLGLHVKNVQLHAGDSYT